VARNAVDRIREAESIAESIEKKARFEANGILEKAKAESEKIVSKAKNEIAVSNEENLAMLSRAAGNVLVQVDEKLGSIFASFEKLAKGRSNEAFLYIIKELTR